MRRRESVLRVEFNDLRQLYLDDIGRLSHNLSTMRHTVERIGTCPVRG